MGKRFTLTHRHWARMENEMQNAAGLKAGSKRIRLMLPHDTDLLTTRDPEKRISEKSFAADLDDAFSSQPLRDSRVAVVVADKTRLCGHDHGQPTQRILGRYA